VKNSPRSKTIKVWGATAPLFIKKLPVISHEESGGALFGLPPKLERLAWVIFKPLEVRAQKNRKVSRPVCWSGLWFAVRLDGLLKIREDHRQARRDGLLGQGCVSSPAHAESSIFFDRCKLSLLPSL
jgi:hypothetical protein